jgi:hypothetical protein
MWVETTSRIMTADMLYGKFYDFYSVSPEYSLLILVTHVHKRNDWTHKRKIDSHIQQLNISEDGCRHVTFVCCLFQI